MAKNDIDELIAVLDAAFRGAPGETRALVPAASATRDAATVAPAESYARTASDPQTLIVGALPGAPAVSTSAVDAQSPTSPNSSPAGGELGRLTTELELLRRATSQQTETLQGTTQALLDSLTGSKSSTAGTVASTAGKALSNVVTSMFGLSPIISGVMSLFGLGRGQDALPPLVEFSLPAAIKQDIVVRPDHSFAPVTYGDAGLAKTASTPTVASTTQVNVQVNAMDSRSFVDRSDDIARAVKEAMLHSHSINDVVVDL